MLSMNLKMVLGIDDKAHLEKVLHSEPTSITRSPTTNPHSEQIWKKGYNNDTGKSSQDDDSDDEDEEEDGDGEGDEEEN